MIRVLHVVNSMRRGGVETTLMNIYRNIDREIIQFDFLVSTNKKCDYDDEILSLGGKIHRVIPRKEGIIKNKLSIKKFFEDNNYKIVHQHVSSLTNIEVIKEAKRAKVPVRIIHSRNTRQGGSKVHKYIHLFNQRNIKDYATDYFACSHLAAEWLYGKKQYNNNEFKIINNGIQSDKFTYNEKVRKEVRAEFGLEEQIVLGNVSRLHNQKNHKFLLQVFKKFNEKYNNSVLILVGDGDLSSEIENKIKELNLEKSVILTGVRSDINRLLQAMDIFVMTSFYEGLPGTIIEAQGAGLPCLISDTITKEVRITEFVKYISLNESEEDWCKEIIDLLGKTKRRNTTNEIKEAGFDIKDISGKLQKYYIEKI